MRRLILKEFGYKDKELSVLSEDEIFNLYLVVMQYIWANLLKDLPKSKVQKLKKAVDRGEYNKIEKIVPNFIKLVQIYGKSFFRDTRTKS